MQCFLQLLRYVLQTDTALPASSFRRAIYISYNVEMPVRHMAYRRRKMQFMVFKSSSLLVQASCSIVFLFLDQQVLH